MPHQIYLLVFPARVSKVNGLRAHWALFVPSSTSYAGDFGKMIQVLGTPFTGYGLEFTRNHNLSNVKEKYEKFLLGETDDMFVVHDREGEKGTDVRPRDELEREAKKVDPPGVSREPLNPAVGRRCQEWTREYVERLVAKGILPQSATGVLDEAKALENESA